MARGKVAEWIRKRTTPRKSAARCRSKESGAARRRSKEIGASEPILPSEAAPKSWSSSSGAPSGSGNDTSTHSKSRTSAFLLALLRWRPARSGGVPRDVAGGVRGGGGKALLLPHALRLQAAL
ncbi:hypothetical protein CFC21_086240, partial [Triticum aestivum]